MDIESAHTGRFRPDSPVRNGSGGKQDAPSGTDAAAECVCLGERIRTLRKAAGLTIRALAERCHLSANTLSLIENDHTSPSVQTLYSLARGLDVSVSSFFDCREAEQAVVYQKQGQRSVLSFPNGSPENLGDGLPPLGAEPILVTLENGPGIPADTNHTGREFVYCLSGRMACVIAGQIYSLASGDSLLFDASLPHRWENADLAPSRLLV
jgi:transcriptional regulator with XRE-family HTH domain